MCRFAVYARNAEEKMKEDLVLTTSKKRKGFGESSPEAAALGTASVKGTFLGRGRALRSLAVVVVAVGEIGDEFFALGRLAGLRAERLGA